MMTIQYFKYSVEVFEIFALIAGLCTWGKWKSTHFKWFIFYLIAIVLFESLGLYFGLSKQHLSTNILYGNIVIPLELSFICWLFYKALPPKFSKTVVALWFVYVIAHALEQLFFKDANYIFFSLSYSAGNMVILILSLFFLYQFVFSTEILTFKRSIMFWFTTGILIFYLGTFPYYGLYNYMAKTNLSSFVNYTWVMIFLNYTMYSMFAIGFIWGKSK